MDEFISNRDLRVLESCVIHGINVQTTHPDFDGEFDLKKLEPYIREGLPLYLKFKSCHMEIGEELVIVCTYKNMPFNVVFAP